MSSEEGASIFDEGVDIKIDKRTKKSKQKPIPAKDAEERLQAELDELSKKHCWENTFFRI